MTGLADRTRPQESRLSGSQAIRDTAGRQVSRATRALAVLGASLIAVPGSASAELLLGLGAPLSGPHAWPGEQFRIGAEFALQRINAAGGVLGEQVLLVPGDDAADPEQAVAVANKLVGDGVAAVIGHWASGASIAAAPVYEAAGTLMISPSSTNPKLTDEGGPNVFRVCGRDDRQSVIAGDFLVERHEDERIAILHDGAPYGQGLAEGTRQRLAELGTAETMFERYTPDEIDYSTLVAQMRSKDIEVAFVGGYAADISLLVREARDQDYDVRFVSGDALATSDFWMATGEAGEGTHFTFFPDPRDDPDNAALVEEFRAQGVEPDGYTLYAFAAVQVWAQAVERAGTLELDPVVATLRSEAFDSVLGPLSFDDKGDIESAGFSLYTWTDGEYRAL